MAGQGGGSGYLSVLLLVGRGVDEARTIALAANCVAALIATIGFVHQRCFDARTFWTATSTAVPAAFVAGTLSVDSPGLRIGIGCVLIAAGLSMLRSRKPGREPGQRPRPLLLLIAGGLIGLVSGATGIGGGIFLAPVLSLAGLASPRQRLGVTSAFVLANSASALAGREAADASFSADLAWVLPAVTLGALLGTLAAARIRHLRSLDLVLAGVVTAAGVQTILP
jgi:uncharacterized membrane protein YfcA